MSSSRADPVLGWNILQGWLEMFNSDNQWESWVVTTLNTQYSCILVLAELYTV